MPYPYGVGPMLNPEPCLRATLLACMLQLQRTIDRYHSLKRKAHNFFAPSFFGKGSMKSMNAESQKAIDVASAAAAAMPTMPPTRERVLKIKDNRIDEGMLAIILDRRLTAAQVGLGLRLCVCRRPQVWTCLSLLGDGLLFYGANVWGALGDMRERVTQIDGIPYIPLPPSLPAGRPKA